MPSKERLEIDDWAYSDKPPVNPIDELVDKTDFLAGEVQEVKQAIESSDLNSQERFDQLIQYINSGPELVLRRIEALLKTIQWALIILVAIAAFRTLG